MGEFVRFAGMYEQGYPPVAGGLMDQAASFVEAFEGWLREVKQARQVEE